MAYLRAVVIKAKEKKNGLNNVRIAVAHNGETRYITTDIIVANNEFKDGQVARRQDSAYLNSKLRALMQQYQETLDEIQCTEGLSCTELVSLIRSHKSVKGITLEAAFNEYLEYTDIAQSTARVYKIAYTTITKFLPPKSIVQNYTTSTVLSLDRNLRKAGLSPSTINNYMTVFAIIVKYTVKSGYVSFKIDPFSTYTPPKKKIRDAWLTEDEVKRIRDCEPTLGSVRLCRDMFMLSYYLGGINLVDLLKIDFKANHRTLRYTRQKISRKSSWNIEFGIPTEAMEIIKKYIGPDGKIKAAIGKYRLTHNFCVDHMPKLAACAGVQSRVIFYSARKSFAQHAFNLGIDTSTIDYILGHSLGSSKSVLYHYIMVTPDKATKAIRKVLDNLK